MIQAIIFIAVYIIGPLSVFYWAYRRYKSKIKPDFIEVVAVILSISLIALLIFTYSSTTTDLDRKDVDLIVDELVQRYPFPVKSKYKDQAAVYGDVARRELQINIYGVSDPIEQLKIVDLVTRLRKQYNSKPVEVLFFQKEIWTELPDGSRQPARDKETLMHKYHVE